MSSLLKVTPMGQQTCKFTFPYNKRFIEFLKQGIKPLNHRQYIDNTSWWVYDKHIPAAVYVGIQYFEDVDYSTLPNFIQAQIKAYIRMQEANKKSRPLSVSNKSPHDTLYIKKSAPLFIIKAAYKALVSVHHPDHGGDPEEFKKVQTAYDELLKK